jgi:GDP-4-dehydro-6-deoxy-D-mannose reductase
MPALASAFPAATLHAARFDLRDAASIVSGVADARPDACIHLAGLASVPRVRSEPDLAWETNLHGTLRLARELVRVQPSCRLLYISSAEIYGASFLAHQAVDESALPAPVNTYAATKAATELALGAMVDDGLRVLRLRPFNHTGPGQSDHYVVSAFARQLARIRLGKQEPVVEVGNLSPARDFLDVRDVCRAYVLCLQRFDTIEARTVLNLASGTPRTMRSVLDELIALAGVHPRVEEAAPLKRATDISRACGNAARAASLLGWRPEIAWETTLRDVLADWDARLR